MNNSLRRAIIILLLPLSLILVNCGGSLESLAEKVLYPVDQANKTEVPATPPDGYKEKVFSLQIDKENPETAYQVHTWYKEHHSSSRPVIVYFHGNGMNLGSMYKINLLKAFDNLDVHWVAMDYPGYGLSTGKPGMDTILMGSSAVIKWTKKKFPNSLVVVWGRSLGAAVASQAISKHQNIVDRFILTSGWDSFLNAAIEKVGKTANSVDKEWLKNHSWDSAAAVKNKVKIDGLMHHGDKDDLIPFKLGKSLHSSFNKADVKLITLTGREHNDVFQERGLWQTVFDFTHKH